MKDRVRVLIVEDEVLIADYICELLQEEGYERIELAHNCADALKLFVSFRPDIILMDINIEGPNTGIELAADRPADTSLVYVTAQQDSHTIQKAITTHPEGYLTKPIKKADLIATMHILSARKGREYMIVRDGHDDIRLEVAGILYVKSDDIYIDVVTAHRRYTLRKSLDAFLHELDDPNFLKVHRSYIVNKAHISQKSAQYVVVHDEKIPVARGRRIDL